MSAFPIAGEATWTEFALWTDPKPFGGRSLGRLNDMFCANGYFFATAVPLRAPHRGAGTCDENLQPI